MEFARRKYQVEAKNKFFKAVREGRRRLLVILATGGGKTIIFSDIAKEMNGQTMILAHRDELVEQAVSKLQMVWPGSDVGVVKGPRNEINHQIIVAGTQTLARELRRKELMEELRKWRGEGKPLFDLIVYDECHHALAPTNVQIIEDLMEPDTCLLGVTATPNRIDGQGLGAVFADDVTQGPVFEKSILEMISEGYLAPIRGIQGNLHVELDKVAKLRGDYELSALGKVMNTPQVNQAAFELWQAYAENRKTVVFAVDVAHTVALTSLYKRNGIKTGYVTGNMALKERKSVLQKFSQNEIQVIVNCAVLTEGYDEPSIECVYLVRPTTSHALYLQMMGRGLRLFPGKKDCLVIDGVKNSEKHRIITVANLFPKPKDKPEKTSTAQSKDKDTRSVSMLSDENEIVIGRAWFEAQEIEVFRSEYNWVRTMDGNFRISIIGGQVQLRKTPYGWSPYYVPKEGEEVLLYDQPLTVDYCMGIAESKIKELKLERFASKNASWRKQRANERQAIALERWGYKVPRDQNGNPTITKGEASEILDRLIEAKNRRLKR